MGVVEEGETFEQLFQQILFHSQCVCPKMETSLRAVEARAGGTFCGSTSETTKPTQSGE